MSGQAPSPRGLSLTDARRLHSFPARDRAQSGTTAIPVTPLLSGACHSAVMRKRTTVIVLSLVAAAALAGGAYAASQSSSQPPRAITVAPRQIKASEQAFINDAARRLHVSPSKLTNALRQALLDRIDAAVKAGHVPPRLARVIRQQIQHGPLLPFGPGPWGLAAGAHIQVAPGPQFFGPPLLVSGAARYLGLTNDQLIKQLSSGRSLAQIAKAQGKTEAGLAQAMTAAMKSQLDRAVKAGHLPRKMAQALLARFQKNVQQIIRSSGPPGPPRAIHFRGAPGAPPPPFLGWMMAMGPPGAARAWSGPPPG